MLLSHLVWGLGFANYELTRDVLFPTLHLDLAGRQLRCFGQALSLEEVSVQHLSGMNRLHLGPRNELYSWQTQGGRERFRATAKSTSDIFFLGSLQMYFKKIQQNLYSYADIVQLLAQKMANCRFKNP